MSAFAFSLHMFNTSSFIFSHYSILIDSARENELILDENDTCEHFLQVPRFDDSVVENLCKEAINTLMYSDNVPTICSDDTMVIGDIHGNLRDLLRLLKIAESHKNVIFLGDYVNRGEFSLECCTLLFTLLVLYPNKYTLLRGNHEFMSVNSNCNDMNMSNKAMIFINEVFSYLPIACILETKNKRYLCVHGGITNSVHSIEQISSIPRPLKSFENSQLAYKIVWADPGEMIGGILETKRGFIAYSKSDVAQFLKKNKFDKIIRAHEYVEKGIEIVFEGNVITVFSSSNYIGKHNSAAYLIITGQGCFGNRISYMPQLRRLCTPFVDIKQSNINHISDCLAIKLKVPAKACSIIPSGPRLKSLFVQKSSSMRRSEKKISTFLCNSNIKY